MKSFRKQPVPAAGNDISRRSQVFKKLSPAWFAKFQVALLAPFPLGVDAILPAAGAEKSHDFARIAIRQVGQDVISVGRAQHRHVRTRQGAEDCVAFRINQRRLVKGAYQRSVHARQQQAHGHARGPPVEPLPRRGGVHGSGHDMLMIQAQAGPAQPARGAGGEKFVIREDEVRIKGRDYFAQPAHPFALRGQGEAEIPQGRAHLDGVVPHVGAGPGQGLKGVARVAGFDRGSGAGKEELVFRQQFRHGQGPADVPAGIALNSVEYSRHIAFVRLLTGRVPPCT